MCSLKNILSLSGIILTSHLWGFLSDTYGRRKILIVASLSAFCCSALASLSMNLWQLAFFRLLNGLWFVRKRFEFDFFTQFVRSISGSTSTIFAYLGEFLGAKTRSRSMMISSVIFAAFCLILPVMAWLIINQTWSFFIPLFGVTYKPWRLFLVACGLPSLLSGLVLIFFPESPKFTFSQVNKIAIKRKLKSRNFIISKCFLGRRGENSRDFQENLLLQLRQQ